MSNPEMGDQPQQPTERAPRFLGRALILFFAATGVGAAFLPPDLVTAWFSRGLYPVWQRLLVPVTGLTPISWTLLVLVVVGSLAIWRTGHMTVAIARRRVGVRAAVWSASVSAFWFVLVTWAWFAWSWGIGYRQLPVERRLGIEAPATVEVADSIGIVNALLRVVREHVDAREAASGDDGKIAPAAERAAIAAAADSVAELVEAWEGWRPAMPSQVKFPPAGLMLTFGSTGVCSPWLLEAHVGSAMPAFDRIATAVHELGHLAGYNGEADAELVMFAAGLRCRDPLVRYAVALHSLRTIAATASHRAGVRSLWMLILVQLPDIAKRDLNAVDVAIKKHKNKAVSAVRDKVYDQYLKSQGISAGNADYGRAIGLWIAAWNAGRLEGLAQPKRAASGPTSRSGGDEPAEKR